MVLAGSYKCKNLFLSATVDVVPWPVSLFSCVVFYDDCVVDFAVRRRDCATHTTITVFDVEEMLPHHQVLYPALLSLLGLAVILGIVCFYNPLNSHNNIFWLSKKFASVFPVSFTSFLQLQ